MSISEDLESLHNFVLSIGINIPPENVIISTTTDIFEECVEQVSLCISSSFHISKPVSYQLYINNKTLVPASEKNLAAYFGSIDGFSLEKSPIPLYRGIHVQIIIC